MAVNVKPITIVGCGPGALEDLTSRALLAIQQAEALVGARRLLDLIPNAPGEHVIVDSDIDQSLNEIERLLQKGKVTVLVTGDPGVCSLARPVIRRFGRAACEVIPGVSAVQTVFARLGLDWHDARIISAHGGLPKLTPAVLASEEKIVILAGSASSLHWAGTLAGQLSGKRRIFIAEDLTLPEEQLREVTAEEVGTMQVSPRTIILILCESVWD